MELITWPDALEDWLGWLEATHEKQPKASEPTSLTESLSLYGPSELDEMMATAVSAAPQLGLLIPHEGRVALVSASANLPWFMLCAWGTEMAAKGRALALACPYETHSLSALLVSLSVGIPLSVLVTGQLADRHWSQLSQAIKRLYEWDLTFVRSKNWQSSAAAFEITNGSLVGVAIAHPDDLPVTVPMDGHRRLYAQAVRGNWPGGEPLRACAGMAANLGDTLIGVGLLSADDGVLISDSQ